MSDSAGFRFPLPIHSKQTFSFQQKILSHSFLITKAIYALLRHTDDT